MANKNNESQQQTWWIVNSASVGAWYNKTIYTIKCVKCGDMFQTGMLDAVPDKCPNCGCGAAE